MNAQSKPATATTIEYRVNQHVDAEAIAALFDASGIRRPTGDPDRIRRMVQGANLTITAWHEARLVGVARALTDYSWCCYLSDLAVDRDYQHQGIGAELTRRVREAAGEETTLVLVSAPEAMAFYPKIGLEATTNAWIIKRAR